MAVRFANESKAGKAGTMSQVLFLSGASMGDALGSSGRSMGAVFEELGHEFVEVNLSRPDWHGLLNRTVSHGSIAFAYSHVGMAADLTAQTSDKREVNFWSANGIPFLSFFGDSPAYFFDRHVAPAKNFGFLYAFPEHLQLRKSLPKQTGFFGLTPLRAMDDTPKREIDFAAKASGKLLFLKNGNDPERLVDNWKTSLPLSTFTMLTDLSADLLGRMATDIACDIDATVRVYFQDKGFDIDGVASLRLFFIAQLDDYMRRVKSTSMAQILKKFPVEIHGYNWEHVDFSKGRANYVHGGDYGASKKLIQDSLGMIDMSPNTGLRPHDRPLRAFGLHTLCITNEQQFFRQHFPDHYGDFSFTFDSDSLENKVAEVLARPKRYVELGIDVADRFRKQFDSRAYGQTIMEMVDCLRLVNGGRPDNMQDFFVWPPHKLS
jgi:hypothetical protein